MAQVLCRNGMVVHVTDMDLLSPAAGVVVLVDRPAVVLI
jgi:hypothetical protein